MSAGADTKANARGGGAHERGDEAPLEPLAQLGDALGGVGALELHDAVVHVDTAELVAAQAARGFERPRMSAGHDRKANTWGGGALEDVDLCLAQHLGELDGPFRTDVVVTETAKDARVGKVREQACQKGEHYGLGSIVKQRTTAR